MADSHLRTAILKTIADLQEALDHKIDDYPRMMYKADQPERIVNSPEEQHALEVEGWSAAAPVPAIPVPEDKGGKDKKTANKPAV